MAGMKLVVAVCVVLAGVELSLANAQAPVAPPLAARQYRDFAFRREGDARRGRALFFDEQRAACIRCHTIDGSAGKAGPDLAAAGDKFPRAELIRAVLEPSATIAVGYGATKVETKTGETHVGVVKQVTADWLELMTVEGKTALVATTEIKEQRGSSVSLMPEGLQAGLSLEEFTDLIEFLATLRPAENTIASNLGMPASIPELARPVTLRPFLGENWRVPAASAPKPGGLTSGLVWFGQIPGVTNTYMVVHQTGKIWRLEKKPAGDERGLFADLGTELFNERGPNGLLGLAFHPKFRENRKYYLKHQVFEEGKIATVLVEKQATPDGRQDSGQPSRRLLKIVSATQDHSGGCIQFGPDGYLYLGMGDTGPQQDPQGHGQDMGLLLGKLARIDVDHQDAGLPYAIPADNPFRDIPGARQEIWALGFREPWRFSFDQTTGDLWVGDVGQDRIEEVAIVRRGENHGWNVFEGFEPFSNHYRQEGVAYVPPVFAYKRRLGNSITGGHVYRGDTRSTFHGVYICGDYTSRRIWGLTQENRRLKTVRQIGIAPQGIASFGTDEAGNLYLVGYEGMVYQIDFSGASFDDLAATVAKP